MTLSIANLGGNKHEAVVDVGGEPLEVEYRPYSIAERKRIVEEYSAEGLDVASAHFLASIVIKWGLVDADGNEYPHDAESIMALPESSDFVNMVMEGLAESRKAGKR